MKTPFSRADPGRDLSQALLLLLVLAPLAQHAMAAENGTLIISSYPLGADIFLDDKYIGKATRNIILENVVVGIHYVEWGKAHYTNCTKIIGIEQGEIAAAHCDLTPREGNIFVKSDPPGALVILDGVTMGKTNTTLTGILEGPHTVIVRYPGYYDCKLQATVVDMVTLPLQCTMEEIPTTGTISANSTPPGADVYLDKVRVGASPVIIRKIEPGEHTLSFNKYGFDDWSTTLDVVAAKIYDINAILFLTNATLSLTSDPSGAAIFYQGRRIGKTPFHSTFFQGTHQILFQGPPGYRNLTIRVIVPFEGANLSIHLECAAPDAIGQGEKDINDNALFDPKTARVLLQDARNLLASGRCVDAFNTAVNASVWAQDIDGDGVPNIQDLWKSIPNIAVYFSPFIIGLLALAAVVCYREASWLNPRVTIEELPHADGEERIIRVTTELRKTPEFFYCAVLLDDKVIDQLDAPGIKEVTLGRLDPGTHVVQVDMDAYRSRLWRNHTEESREIVIP
jgi:hypothetical protein